MLDAQGKSLKCNCFPIIIAIRFVRFIRFVLVAVVIRSFTGFQFIVLSDLVAIIAAAAIL